MLTNLNRTEEIHIKNDIHNIAKSLATIASSMPNTTTEKTEKTELFVKDGDPFFGKIHMSKEHMDAWEGEFDSDCLALVSLMEECAELQQASSKYYRKYRNTVHANCISEKAAMTEEIAHVMIDIRMICDALDISPEAIQQEIYKKYPEGYDLTTYMADNKPYCVERSKGSE